MNITEMKERLLQSIELWSESRIDDMVKRTPSLIIPSVYMKRAAHNIVAKNKDSWSKQLDMLALFLANEEGEVNVETIFEDVSKILHDMEATKFDVGVFHGTIGKGLVTIDLPDNVLTTIIFGDCKTIQFTIEDFNEMKALIAEI